MINHIKLFFKVEIKISIFIVLLLSIMIFPQQKFSADINKEPQKNTDYVYHYSAGYYTKWEAENNVEIDSKSVGIKHDFGTDGVNYWYSGTDSTNNGKLLVTGPDYRQDRKYLLWYSEDRIIYIVNFKLKIDGKLSKGVPGCCLSCNLY